MMKKIVYLGLALFLLQACTSGQKNNANTESSESQKFSSAGDSTEVDNQDAETGELFFSQEWTWEYTDEEGQIQTMHVYWNPELKYWLFEKYGTGYGDDMTDWVLLKPNGVEWSAYQDPELDSKKKILKRKWSKGYLPEDLPDTWMPTGKTAEFGQLDMGFKPYDAVEFEVTHASTSQKSFFYLAESDIDMTPLYAFNGLSMDAKLPIAFPDNIPGNKIALSGKPVPLPRGYSPEFKFRYRSYTEYYISLDEYEFVDDTPYYND